MDNNGRFMIREEMFSFIYQMALSDATNRVAHNGERGILSEDYVKSRVLRYTECIVLGDNTFSFEDAVAEIQQFNSVVSFGMIQKLLNMVMKYFYIRFCDDLDIKKHFSVCHAPMDGLMRDFVFNSYRYIYNSNPGFTKSCAWSKLGDNDNPIIYYSAYQDAVDQLINCANNHGFNIANRIEFDYSFYLNARELRDGNISVQEIWHDR